MVLASGSATFQYLSVDHLGTPILATDGSGGSVWLGGFEPFGLDWQAGTPDGSRESGVFLRFPGQWFDETWEEASLGAEMAYNVHRWYQPNTGKYQRADPIRQVYEVRSGPALYLIPGNSFVYAGANPLHLIDPQGLAAEEFFCVLKHTLFGLGVGGLAGLTAGCAAGALAGLPAGGVGALPGCAEGAVVVGGVGAAVGALGGALLGRVSCGCDGLLPQTLPMAPGEETDCRKVKQFCIERCSDETLPTGTLDGAPYFRCLRECLDSYGC
jgi:RHS repeat-associated protein